MRGKLIGNPAYVAGEWDQFLSSQSCGFNDRDASGVGNVSSPCLAMEPISVSSTITYTIFT